MFMSDDDAKLMRQKGIISARLVFMFVFLVFVLLGLVWFRFLPAEKRFSTNTTSLSLDSEVTEYTFHTICSGHQLLN